MVSISIDFGWHQTFTTLLFAIASNHFHLVYGTAAVATASSSTSNQHPQIIDHQKFLSQSNANVNGLQPSRLRTLLINDLRNILVKSVCVKLHVTVVYLFLFLCIVLSHFMINKRAHKYASINNLFD